MNDDLLQKGKLIVKELGGEHQDSLRKWMAHYVAELMEKSLSADEKEAQKASEECAQIILRLWQMEVQEQMIQIEHEINSWKYRVHKEEGESYEKLRCALMAPESFESSRNAVEWSTIRSLSEIENWLIGILQICEVLNRPRKESLDETTQKIANQLEAEMQAIRQQVAKIFPEFSKLDLTNLDTIHRQTVIALRSVDRLRHTLLWKEEG